MKKTAPVRGHLHLGLEHPRLTHARLRLLRRQRGSLWEHVLPTLQLEGVGSTDKT